MEAMCAAIYKGKLASEFLKETIVVGSDLKEKVQKINISQLTFFSQVIIRDLMYRVFGYPCTKRFSAAGSREILEWVYATFGILQKCRDLKRKECPGILEFNCQFARK